MAARSSYRHKRIGEMIRTELMQMLYQGLKDPRLHGGMITVVAVDVTNDLQHAKIHISVLQESERKDVMDAFDSAKGFIRRELGKRLRLRLVPEIEFELDTSLEEGMHLYNLIEEVNRNDNSEDNLEDNLEDSEDSKDSKDSTEDRTQER